MVVLHHFHDARAFDVRAVALGFFDGLHPGHQRVIAAAQNAAGPRCAVVTFWPHPQHFINPAKAPPLLTGLPHKLHRFRLLDVPLLCLLPFDRHLQSMSRERFMEQLQEAFPRLTQLAHGPNFFFAHQRRGSPQWLAQWCAENECGHTIVPFAGRPDQPLSSSRIRQAVQNAELALACGLLGRPYSIYGRIVHGQGRGRMLGFPTVNLRTHDSCLPPRGVYAGRARWRDGQTAAAAINIGTQPTFHGRPAIEAHLLDAAGDWYGRHLELEFHERIRDEHQFASAGELAGQLARDVATVRRLVASSPPPTACQGDAAALDVPVTSKFTG